MLLISRPSVIAAAALFLESGTLNAAPAAVAVTLLTGCSGGAHVASTFPGSDITTDGNPSEAPADTNAPDSSAVMAAANAASAAALSAPVVAPPLGVDLPDPRRDIDEAGIEDARAAADEARSTAEEAKRDAEDARWAAFGAQEDARREADIAQDQIAQEKERAQEAEFQAGLQAAGDEAAADDARRALSDPH